MARCEDCIHNKICDERAVTSGIPFVNSETCEHFKPTADVVPKSEEGAECPTCYGTGRIGTTNWLTKNISKKQLAEEKAKAIAEHEQYIKTEYAREIFEEIEKLFFKNGVFVHIHSYNELKKKYTGV